MRLLIRDAEVIRIDEYITWLQAQAISINADEYITQMRAEGFTLIGSAEETTTPSATSSAEETVAEETVTIDGKTYTKSELKKLLE